MGKIVIIDEEDLKRLIREVLDERNISASIPSCATGPPDEDLVTSLYDIAEVLHCSLPKAQHIKNSIPKDQYFQHGRKFAIRKSILLKTNKDLRKSK